MNASEKTILLKKYFPSQELTAGELHLKAGSYPETSWFFYGENRFSYIFEINKGNINHQFELYRSDGEYASHYIGAYEMIIIYDVSDINRVRGFLLEYIQQLDTEDLVWSLKDAVDYF